MRVNTCEQKSMKAARERSWSL